MQRVSNGYTLIEVMIVLAVSSFMIIFSMNFLGGHEGRVKFTQSMRDIQSKMQDWINDAPTGFTSGTSNYHCNPLASPVQILNGPRPATDPPNCIFLGKAIQFTQSPSKSVFAYSVFGLRESSNELSGNLKDALPVPATGSNGTGNANLTEAYSLEGTTTVKSVVQSSGVTVSGSNSYMGGFYLSLNTDQVIGQNGSSNLNAYQYQLGNSTGNSLAAIQCIEMTIIPPSPCRLLGSATNPLPLTMWQICFKNENNSATAQLTIKSNNGEGATTQLDYISC